MFKVKDVEPKLSLRKKNITIANCYIENGNIVDEDGNIVERLQSIIPDGIDIFSIKINIELPEEEVECDEASDCDEE